MPEQVDPPGSDHVHIPIAFPVIKIDAFRPLNQYGRSRFVVLVLGAWVPDMMKVANQIRFDFRTHEKISL